MRGYAVARRLPMHERPGPKPGVGNGLDHAMNVRTLCLGVLFFGDATGYEIRKSAQDGPFAHFIQASFGAIYPALIKLEQEGLVASREERQSGKPDRKIYSLTPDGLTAFKAALNEAPQDDVLKSEFLLIMLCAELVDRDHLSSVIDGKMRWLDNKVAHLEDVAQCCHHAGSQFVVGYGLAMYRAKRAYLEQNRHKIEDIAAPDETVRVAAG